MYRLSVCSSFHCSYSYRSTGSTLLQTVQQDIQGLLQLHYVLDLQVLNLERKINLMILNRKTMDDEKGRPDEELSEFFGKLHPLGKNQQVTSSFVNPG